MSLNTSDVADDLDIIRRKLDRGVRDGDLIVDVAGLVSVLSHASRELRAGHWDSGRVVGRRIGDALLDSIRKDLPSTEQGGGPRG